MATEDLWVFHPNHAPPELCDRVNLIQDAGAGWSKELLSNTNALKRQCIDYWPSELSSPSDLRNFVLETYTRRGETVYVFRPDSRTWDRDDLATIRSRRLKQVKTGDAFQRD